MTNLDNRENAKPLALSSPPISDHPELVELATCWQSCRSEKMLPTKHDFEGAILAHPTILPNMTIIEMMPEGEMNYIFIGSDRASRRSEEDTGREVGSTLAPAAAELTMLYAAAAFEAPFAMFWTQSSLLPSGAVATDHNLAVILADDSGKAIAIAIASVVDAVYTLETKKGGFLIGSAGIDVTPIDIGFGIPDLPRSAEAS